MLDIFCCRESLPWIKNKSKYPCMYMFSIQVYATLAECPTKTCASLVESIISARGIWKIGGTLSTNFLGVLLRIVYCSQGDHLSHLSSSQSSVGLKCTMKYCSFAKIVSKSWEILTGTQKSKYPCTCLVFKFMQHWQNVPLRLVHPL